MLHSIDVGTLNRFDGINGNGTANIPLNAMYLDNVADFIKISSKYGIYVVPTLDWIPQNNYFMTKCNVEEEAKATNLEFPNVQYMSENCVNAKAEYVKIFLDGLKDRVSMKLLNTIAWISITNEAYYSTDHLPFSSKSINVTTSSNNKTYDMANPNDRQMCANENALYYVNIVKMNVEKEYENILITIGLFTYFAVGKTIQENYGLLPLKNIDNRFPFLPNALLTSKSKINLLDQHIYHTPGWSMKKDLESVEWKSLNFSKNCIVMGEFGAFKVPVVFPTPEAAAIAMKNQQIESCNLYNFSGWLFWTFDTFEQPFLWNMKSNDYIRDVLSPLNRPSACDDDMKYDMIKDKNEAKRYNKCRKLYANRSACNNDNVTFGGCVWCDIVDQPPFCTEIYIAKTWPHPPQFPPWRCDKNITNGLQNES